MKRSFLYPIYYYQFREEVNFTDFTISFRCFEDSNCTLFYDFIYYLGNNPVGFFTFYNPGRINHDADPPIQKTNAKENFFIYYLFTPLEVGLKGWYFDWEVIKYKDKSSLIDSLTNNKREYYSGHVKNEERSDEDFVPYDNYLYYFVEYDEKIGYYIDFLRLKFMNSHGEYLLYKRTKREFMDVIANIGALFSTVKFIFSMIFSFYSKNYDNYEVIGKILNQPKEKKKKIICLIPQVKKRIEII